MQVGDFVHYKPKVGVPENGRIKKVLPMDAFVVYKCGGEWNRYQDYTGQLTNADDLQPGWVDKDGNPIDTPKNRVIMTEEEIQQKIDTICEGKFKFEGVNRINHSQGHPYTIGPKHVLHASKYFGGKLGTEAILGLERQKGPSCACGGCNARYEDHKSNKVLFLTLLKTLEHEEASQVLKQVSLEILEPEKIEGIAFVETPERYRISPPKENTSESSIEG
jgi:hypothetical protein